VEPASESASATRADSRALTPVAVVLLVAVTVLLAVGVGTATLEVAQLSSPAPTATIALDATADRVVLTHRGGDPIDVGELRVVVAVNGEPLRNQPPVPFFSAAGFRPGPTGPFNAATPDEWTAGTSASFRIAGTNDPTPAPGDRMTVRLVVDDQPIATLEGRVTAG
jgi:FlaG/FlaF family flagellin (archaellin)